MTLTHNEGVPSILVVDDIVGNLKLLEGMLRGAGYRVRPVPSGKLALRAAKSDPPDLILLDINMPHMDGYEVCRRLKADEALREIPVIFLSVISETQDKVKAFQSGGVDYITKPAHAEEVLARVETHLSLRRYQIDLQQHNTALQDTLLQLKDAQTLLVQSEKMASLGLLTAGLAHELNNPVNAIQSSALALRKVLSGNRDTPEDASPTRWHDLDLLTDNIVSASQRAAAVIRDLRIFSRLDEAPRSLADIHENLDVTLNLLRHRVEHSIIIERAYGNLPPVLCQPGRLNQVFMNLLVNAIEAIEGKPTRSDDERVRVITSKRRGDEGELALVEIEDTGPGISEGLRARIFEPFFTTKEVGQGTGLGLSICLGIVESHRGTITVHNAPGGGARFTVKLPLNAEV